MEWLQAVVKRMLSGSRREERTERAARLEQIKELKSMRAWGALREELVDQLITATNRLTTAETLHEVRALQAEIRTLRRVIGLVEDPVR